MSWINLGEVFSTFLRRGRRALADDVVLDVRARVRTDRPTGGLVIEAAAIKAGHRLSYADAFAVATARAHDATLLTGDPEIMALDGLFAVEDLR